MKTSTDPVRDYLSAVERESSALPADRRQELLADLAEHIEVTRTERPDAAIGEILAELGDPRTIAATALAEAGNGTTGTPARGDVDAPARRGKVHPLIPLLMLTLSLPFTMIFSIGPEAAFDPGAVFGFLFRVTGAVLLCTSVHWTAVQKTTGVLLTVIVPTIVIVTWNLISGWAAGEVPALLGNLGSLALMVGTAVWLWRARRA
ncbi:HAAS signaling domain-containing protein [Streptomyces sp. NPDC048650]|uniref:HAAS signaling domain-containing protein n=1 Tax=Streptomyces sp. NPDC048650 TaxID=3365583 RepID=UPI0037237606